MATTAAFDSSFPKANGPVIRTKIYKGVLYVCGQFTTVDGMTRNSFAAIDPVTNAVLPMTLIGGPPPGSYISDFVILNDIIYILGNTFTSPRNNTAAFDLNGNLLAWDPNLGALGGGNAIATDGTQIFIVGSFTTVNGATTRNRAAAFDPITGVATAWNPNFNSPPVGLFVSGSTIYVVGAFTNVNGATPRNRACAVDNVTGVANGFDPHPNFTPATIEVYNGAVYLAGTFTLVNNGAFSRRGVAAFNPMTGACITGFNANLLGPALNVHQFGGKLYVPGNFSFPGGPNNFAILNPVDGSLLSPTLNLSDAVNDVTFLGKRFFLVGNFNTYLGNTERTNLASYVLGSSTLKSWAPKTDGTVKKVQFAGNRVYVAGAFSNVTGPNGTFVRQGIAAFDSVTGDVLPFAPNPSADVDTLIVIGTDVYFCGVFSIVLGQPREKAAAVDSDGNLLPWDPNLGAGPTHGFDLRFDGSNLFIGGTFTTVNGGTPRNNLCKVDIATGIVDPVWDPNVNGQIKALAFDGIWIYLGGSFTTVGGQPRLSMARVSSLGVGSVDVGWVFDVVAGGPVDVLSIGPGFDLYAGGSFTSINGTSQPGITHITSLGVLDPAWANLLAPDDAPSLAILNTLTDIFIGQAALHFGGQYRPAGTSAGSDGTLHGWAPKLFPKLGIYSFSVDLSSQTLYVGGNFSFAEVYEAGYMAAFDIPPPAPLGLPRAPVIEFLNRKQSPVQGPQLTLLKWKPVVMDEQNNYIDVLGYRVYRTSSLNLEDPTLIAEITTLDIRGFVDTMFTEEIDGFFKYCVSAFNVTGEGGKSCIAAVSLAQSDRI